MRASSAIHLMMRKSLSPTRGGRVNFHRAASGSLCVLLVLVLFVCFSFFALVFVWLFSVFPSTRDDDIGPRKGPPTDGFF